MTLDMIIDIEDVDFDTFAALIACIREQLALSSGFTEAGLEIVPSTVKGERPKLLRITAWTATDGDE